MLVIEMNFRLYKQEDANEIISWIKNERELRLWSMDRYKDYPITSDDINRNYHDCMKDHSFYPFTLEIDGKVVGHLIMRHPNGDHDIIRLGFIIVDNNIRGRGYGKTLINEAINYAINHFQPKEINLGVFTINDGAYHCYQKVGFETIRIDKDVYTFHDEHWDCAEMVYRLKRD